jgi:glycosyltransferase involved in cell wall biosynthesis
MHLVLFFTRRVSLVTWDRLGILERELALYRRLAERGCQVSFVTWGGNEDVRYAEQIAPARVACNRLGLPRRLYECLMPQLHSTLLRSCDLIKTNQTDGADVALSCARYFNKPLIARSGYHWSQFEICQHGRWSRPARRALRIERRVFSAADRVVVTSRQAAQRIQQQLPPVAARLRIVPNYVDSHWFEPCQPAGETVDLVHVGRIVQQKNLQALLEAMEELPVRLLVVGTGPWQPALERRFAHLADRVIWQGKVRHRDLPGQLARARVFVLPSLYEGHPKALLEAMAAGLPIVAADRPGIRELVRHNQTGLLCEPHALGLKQAVSLLLSDPAACRRLGQAAQEFARQHASLDIALEHEWEVYRQLQAGIDAGGDRAGKGVAA